MKKQVKKFRKSKIFNSLNIILIALLFVELIFLMNQDVFTGNPVKGIFLDEGDVLVSQTQNSLGTLVIKEGIVELIIVDNFEKPELSKELYYLNENGKRYLLSTDSRLPVSAKIKVTGYLKDNTLSFSNSPTKSASLQGTSYTVTSTMIEPWPKTLGEQKYVVVYLVNESEINSLNVTNITNGAFGKVNEWIQETSYGKASISYGYLYVGALPSNITTFWQIMDYAVMEADPFVDFTQYDGIIVFHPTTEDTLFYGGLGNVGKVPINTSDGFINLYQTWINNFWPGGEYVIIHEMGHNFGLMHATRFVCGDYPNREAIGSYCDFAEYGDIFDVMGNGFLPGEFSVRNKAILGWINDENIVETTEGIFFIIPLNNDSTNTSKVHGIEIPIIWDLNYVQFPSSPGFYLFGVTDYYIEYRTSLPLVNGDNETYYGINLSDINNKRGLIVRLGRDNNIPLKYTFLLSMHPNAVICSGAKCDTGPGPAVSLSPLFENETYVDSFNKMNITVLDMNESGALINITRWQTCTDSDSGISPSVSGTVTATNLSGTYNYRDACTSSYYLKEFYCNNKEAKSQIYYCRTVGCSNGKCNPPSSPCYTDPKTKRRVCVTRTA